MQTEPYAALAGGYDSLMADADYPARAAFLRGVLERRPVPVKTVLDLACGSGSVAWLLAREGWRVIATDASEEMLTEAMGKASAFPGFAPPLFVLQSMERLNLGTRTVEAAVSTMDSINYLTRAEDLRETFRRVYASLSPGGLFVFDLNTPYKFRRMDRQIYLDQTRDIFCVWRTFFSEEAQICTYQVDLFRHRPDGAWDRRFEEHRERAWDAEELRGFLAEAGFVNIRVTGDLSEQPPAEMEDRWTVWAEKENPAW